MQLIIITGLSGAGKGLAARHFEDFGFFCVDNLPPALLPSFAELLERGQIGKAALVVDVRGGDAFDLVREIDALDASDKLDLRILFLDCDDDALMTRFKETRRKHPLGGDLSLPNAIEREREALIPLRERADKVINTSQVTPRELRGEIERTFVEGDVEAGGMLIQVESFGFKHGPHASADLVFDVRFLPNPNYDREIGHLDGFCEPIKNYVLSPQITQEFLRRWEDFLSFLIPQFEAEGKAYLTIAVGCTGGRHRSVCLSNWLAERLREAGHRTAVTHRDLVRNAPASTNASTKTPDSLNSAHSSIAAPSQTFGAPLPEAANAEVAPAERTILDDGTFSGVRVVGDDAVMSDDGARTDGNTEGAPTRENGGAGRKTADPTPGSEQAR